MQKLTLVMLSFMFITNAVYGEWLDRHPTGPRILVGKHYNTNGNTSNVRYIIRQNLVSGVGGVYHLEQDGILLPVDVVIFIRGDLMNLQFKAKGANESYSTGTGRIYKDPIYNSRYVNIIITGGHRVSLRF